MTNGTEPETRTIKVANLIDALNYMGEWCNALAQVLEGHGRDNEITITPELHDKVFKKPPQAFNQCP